MNKTKASPYPQATEFCMVKSPTRNEFLVAYFDGDLKNLRDILEDPRSFLEDHRNDWPLMKNTREWRLDGDITAHFRYGFSSKSSISKFLLTFGYKSDNWADSVDSFADIIFDPHKATLKQSSFTEQVTEATDKGSFYLEFALYTQSLFVTYYPPAPTIRALANSLDKKAQTVPKKLNLKFTPATLAYSTPLIFNANGSVMPDDNSYPLRTLHFDLMDPNATEEPVGAAQRRASADVHKAEFIKDMLFSPLDVLAKVNQQFKPQKSSNKEHMDNAFYRQSQFTRVGSDLQSSVKADPKIWRNVSLRRPASDLEDMSNIQKLIVIQNMMPTITAEGLSGTPADPCTQWVLEYNPSTDTNEAVEIVVKSY